MTTAKRDPADVIDRVIAAIPEEMVPAQVDLIGELKAIKEDSAFRPPEDKYPAWVRLADVLTKMLPQPSRPDAEEWHKQIGRIVRGEE